MSYPRYIRVRQYLLDKLPNKLESVTDVLSFAEENGLSSHLLLSEEEPKLLWGSIVYKVADDGKLGFHASNLDTSG